MTRYNTSDVLRKFAFTTKPRNNECPGGPMSHRFKLSRLLAVTVGLAITAPVAVLIGPADAATATTAWQNGSFSVNPSGVVSESDIVLGAANTGDSQSMPLGN